MSISPLYGLCSVWTYTDNRDRRFQFLLQESDVVGESLWKLALGSNLGEVGFPTGQFCINRFDESVADVVGEVASDAAVFQFVGGACLDGLEVVSPLLLFDGCRLLCFLSLQ